jgi:hypothetical protein
VVLDVGLVSTAIVLAALGEPAWGALVGAVGVAAVRAVVALREPLRYLGGIRLQVDAQGPFLQLLVEADFDDEVRVWVTGAENYRELGGHNGARFPWTLKWREDGGNPKLLWWGITPVAPEVADILEFVAVNQFRMFSVASPGGWLATDTGGDFASLRIEALGRHSQKRVTLAVPLDPTTLVHGGPQASS